MSGVCPSFLLPFQCQDAVIIVLYVHELLNSYWRGSVDVHYHWGGSQKRKLLTDSSYCLPLRLSHLKRFTLRCQIAQTTIIYKSTAMRFSYLQSQSQSSTTNTPFCVSESRSAVLYQSNFIMSSSESSTKRELLEALAYYNKSLNPQSATPNPPSANFSSTEPFAFPEEFVYSAYIGVYMIPVRDRRLERVNIEGITIPKYIDQGFWHLAKEVGYVAFASDLQRNNREMVLSRMQTEACWMLEITRRYQEWDPRQQAALAADPLLPGAWMFKSRMLDQAKEQVRISATKSTRNNG